MAGLRDQEPSLPDRERQAPVWCQVWPWSCGMTVDGNMPARRQDRVTVGFSCFRACVFPEGEQS